MGRTANISPLGLYEWDHTVFDLFEIPKEMDRDTLIQNLLAETAELEVIYPNPVVFKNLVGVWSRKEIDVWNRLYKTTQYEYNPIENYDRMESGTTTGTATATRTGTDTATSTETQGGRDTTSETTGRELTDERTESIETGGTDTLTTDYEEGGTQTDNREVSVEDGGTETVERDISVEDGGTETVEGSHSIENGGSDTVTTEKTAGHWIAGYDSVPAGDDDGLVKQTRDSETVESTTEYGKTESGESTQETTFGKTVDTNDDATTTFGKTVDTTDDLTQHFGKTVDNVETTAYGKTEDVTENRSQEETGTKAGEVNYGKTVNGQSSRNQNEQTITENDGGHELRAHGNIGVTTTQEMIKQQRAVEMFNLYNIIIESFKMRFCILVY